MQKTNKESEQAGKNKKVTRAENKQANCKDAQT